MGVYLKFKRKPEGLNQFAVKNSTWHDWINRGLMVPGVALGPRAVGYPEHELNAIAAARLASKSEDEIRALVSDLIEARATDDSLVA